MNCIKILLFIFITSPLYSQVEISNKNYNYFDLKEIENNDFQSQILLSATFDEIGYNGEWYKIKKNYFSLNFSASYKRLLPNIGWIWTPLTLEDIAYFPQNGLSFSVKGKWYFNHRKFSFVGLKLSKGYYWVNDKEIPNYVEPSVPSITTQHLFWARNQREGIDLFVGKKFVNKLISEIMFEAGIRGDRYKYQFQCASNCNSGGNDPIFTHKGNINLYHFQLFLTFDIFSK